MKETIDHKIISGDTAFGIAQKYKTDLETIKKLNPWIKDINLIRAGDLLKVPKMEAPKLNYQDYFKQGLEKLYSGTYGLQGGREKLGNELKIKFPTVDVWKDIYSRIPDHWEKIAFPESVKEPKQLPKEKQPAWLKVGSFITENILSPVQEKITEKAWKLFQKVPEIPDPYKIYQEAKIEVVPKILKYKEEKFGPIIEKFADIPEDIYKAVEKIDAWETGTRKKISETLVKAWNIEIDAGGSLWQDYDIPVYRDFKEAKIRQKELEVMEGKLKFQKGEIEAEKKLELKDTMEIETAAGYLTWLNRDILSRKDDFADVGIIIKEDISGNIDLGSQAAMERSISESQQAHLNLLLKQFPDIDPEVSQAMLKDTEVRNARASLTDSLVTNLQQMMLGLREPEIRKDEDSKFLKKRLDDLIKTSSYLEGIDSTLESLDLELDRNQRSLTDVGTYYEKEIPLWWSEIEKYVGPKLKGYLQSEFELTKTQEEEWEKVFQNLDIVKAKRINEILEMINQSQVFQNIQNNLSNIILDPKFAAQLKSYYEKDPIRNKKDIQDLDSILKFQTYWEENEKYIKQGGFIAKILEAKTDEEFKKLKGEAKANEALNREQIDACLDFISYMEKSYKMNNYLIESTHRLGKAAIIFNRAIGKERLATQKKEGERYLKYAREGFWGGADNLVPGLMSVWGSFKNLKIPVGKTLEFKEEEYKWKDYEGKWQSRNVFMPHIIEGEMKVGNILHWGVEAVEEVMDQIYFKTVVPIVNTTISAYRLQFQNMGENLAVSDFEEYEKIGIKTKRDVDAWRMVMELPPEAHLPEGMTRRQAVDQKLMQGYWIEAFKYYRSPAAFEEIILKEDTKLEFRDGELRIGPYSYPQFTTPEQLYHWNPKIIQMGRNLKAGTKLTIPRFKPLPVFSDVLSDQVRYKWYKEHGLAAMLVDDFLPYFAIPDPFMRFHSTAKLFGLRMASEYGISATKVSMKALEKTAFTAGGVAAVQKVKRLEAMGEQFLKLASLRGTDYAKFPKFMQQKEVPIDKLRAKIGQSTVMEGMPEQAAARINTLLRETQEITNVNYLMHETANILKVVAEKRGIKDKELKEAINLFLVDPGKPPTELVSEVLGLVGLTTADMLKWSKSRPFLKDPLEVLYKVSMEKEPFRRQLAFDSVFNKLGNKGEEYFMAIYSDWGKTFKESKFRTRADVLKFKDEFLKKYSNEWDFWKIEKEVKMADDHLLNLKDDLEMLRKIGEEGRVVARLPNGVELFIPKDAKKLKQAGHLIWDRKTGKPKYIYDPDRFKKGEGEMWADLMGHFLGDRIQKTKKLPTAVVNNQMEVTEKLTGMKSFYAEVKKVSTVETRAGKIVPVIKEKIGKPLADYYWIEKLGKDKFQEALKKKTLKFIEERRVEGFRKVRYQKGPKNAVYLFDNLISDFYLNFIKQPLIGLSKEKTPGFEMVRKFLKMDEKVRESDSREMIMKLLQQLSPKGGKKVTIVSKRIDDWREQIENLQTFISGGPGLKEPGRAGEGYAVWKTQASETINIDQKISDNMVEFFLKRAAGWDFLKSSDSGRKFLMHYRDKLRSIDSIEFHNAESILDIILLESYGLKEILPTFSRSILLKDRLLPTELSEFAKAISLFTEHASEMYYHKLLPIWVREKKVKWVFDKKAGKKVLRGEKIEKYKELVDKDIIGRQLEKIQKAYLMGSYEKPINTIISKIWGFIPWIRKSKEELEAGLSTVLAEAKTKTVANLKKVSEGDGKEILIAMREIAETKVPTIKPQIRGIKTTPKEAAFLKSAEKAKWLNLSRRYFFEISDVTPKDKAIVEFFKANKIGYEIVQPYKIENVIFTKTEMVRVLKEADQWDWLSLDGALSDDAFFILLNSFPTIPPKLKALGLYERGLKDFVWKKVWDNWCGIVQGQLKTTKKGKRILDKITELRKTEQKAAIEKEIKGAGMREQKAFSRKWEELGFQPQTQSRLSEPFLSDEFFEIIGNNFQRALEEIGAKGITARIVKGKKVLSVSKELGSLPQNQIDRVYESWLRRGIEVIGTPDQKIIDLVIKPVRLPIKVNETLNKFCDVLRLGTFRNGHDIKMFYKQAKSLEDLKLTSKNLLEIDSELVRKANNLETKIARVKIDFIKNKKYYQIGPNKELQVNIKKVRTLKETGLEKKLQILLADKGKEKENIILFKKLKEEIRVGRKQLDIVEEKIKNTESSFANTMWEITGIKQEYDSAQLYFMQILGREKTVASRIEILEKSLREKKILLASRIEELKKPGIIDQKIVESKWNLQAEIESLEDLRTILPDLLKIQKAGIDLNWRRLWSFAKGKPDAQLLKDIKRIEKALKEVEDFKSPILLKEEQHKLLNVLTGMQKDTKRIKIKEESRNKIITEYINNIENKDYVLPIIRTPKMPTSELGIKERIEDLANKGTKVIIDLTGDLKPYKNYTERLRIVSIPELSKAKLPFITEAGDLPFKIEVDGFIKLRELFLESKNILIWDVTSKRATMISETLQKVYLSKDRVNAMKAAKELFFSHRAVLKATRAPGPTFRFARSAPQYLKVWGDPKGMAIRTSRALEPTEVVEWTTRKYPVDKYLKELEVKLRESNLILPGTRKFGDASEKVSVLVMSPDARLISDDWLRKLAIATKSQGAKLFLPQSKIEKGLEVGLTKGEQIIKEFLVAEKIPYTHLTKPLQSGEVPLYLFTYGKKFDKVRQSIYTSAVIGKRLFTSKDQIQKKILDDILKQVRHWLQDISKYPPAFIQAERVLKLKSAKSALARWKLVLQRDKAKKYWRKETDRIFEEVEGMEKRIILDETGGLVLTLKQRTAVTSKIAELKNAVRMLDVVMDWDKKPMWIEKVSQSLAKALDLKYARDKNYYSLAGFPITTFEKLKYSEQWIKRLQKLVHGSVSAYRGAKTVFGTFKSLWIYSVLYWRVAWYIKNSYDDGIRGAMAAQSVEYFIKSQAMMTAASALFIKKFAGDLKMLPKFLNKPMKGEGKELITILGKKKGGIFKKHYEGAMTESRKHPYQVWDPNTAVKEKGKGLWNHLDEKLWKAELDPMVSFEQMVRNKGMMTPKGEKLTGDMLDYLCEAGLFQVTSDPIYLRKIISMMDETHWWNRLRKRATVLQADIETFANFTENMRRQLLVHDLLFRKAMTLSETKAKTWGYLFNYRDLTIVGKKFRSLFPFYSFNQNTLRLFTTIVAKGGPRHVFAANAFLDAWSESTKDLPEWARNRIPIGNKLYWSPWMSFFQILSFFRDPVQSLEDFANNPHRVPLGFGWDPYWTSFINLTTEKNFFDISREKPGWTEQEIDRLVESENLKRDISGKDKFYELLFTFVPFTKAFAALGEIDMYMLTDGLSIWHSKKLREFAKQFGINLLKWDDMNKFRTILFDTPPHFKQAIQKEIKAENPLVWKALQNYFAKTAFLKSAEEAKKDPVKATYELQIKGALTTYYNLEDAKKGSGKQWLERNPEIKKELDKHFEEKGKTVPWAMWGNARYNRGLLAGEIKAFASRIYKEEVIAKTEILGIEVPFAVPGTKQEFLDTFFDERGKLKISSPKEFEVIMGEEWIKKIENQTQKDWQEVIKDVAKVRYHEWLYFKTKGETEEEKAFADKMAKWQLVLPDNIDELPEEEAQRFWSAYWKYFDKFFTEEQKTQWHTSLKENHGEWFYEYRMKMREYCDRWGKVIKGFGQEGFQFFEVFYSQPDWFQKFYFLKNPNKANWYPFAREWTRRLSIIEKKENETYIFQTTERKELSKYFWENEDKIKLWDKDNVGFYNYMKTWQKVIALSEADPQSYFPVFFSQDITFRERFFKRNPDKRIYYKFLADWVALIAEDQKNWKEQGKRTSLSSNFFWAKDNTAKRNAYGKAKFVAKGHSILDYLLIWKDFFHGNNEKVEDFFPRFFSQPDWFKTHYFNNHPHKKIYYEPVFEWGKRIQEDKKILDTTGKSPKTAREYYLKEIKGKISVQEAWEKDNPGIINYLDTWSAIIQERETNPESYFPNFYSQSETFQERFFRNNPSKAVYYPFLSRWITLIKKDKENWTERGISTHEASEYFNTWKDKLAGKLYAKDNPITKDKNQIHYLEEWQEIMKHTEENPKEFFSIFDKKEEWFKNHYYKNHPDRKIYYSFARELGNQKPEDFSSFFWAEKYVKEREAWERDKPGFLEYMGFWKKLGTLGSVGAWDLYFQVYYSLGNKKYRDRHWKNNPLAEKRFSLFRKYQLMPSIKWEEKRAKRDFLKANPMLLEWWSEDLSSEDAKLRVKVESYYEYLDNIQADGIGTQYYREVKKWKLAAAHYLEDEPEILMFFQKNSKKYTGDKPNILSLSSAYHQLELQSERQSYMLEHPELKDYFYYLNPPGIRSVLDLQTKYFQLDDKFKAAYLKLHPELIDYWDVSKLPWSSFFNPQQFMPFQKVASKVEKCFEEYLNKNWVKAETLRQSLPALFINPGDSEEDDWFKDRIYKKAMSTWVKLIPLNEFYSIYFFRQLPDWIRDIYYEKHPEKQYLSKVPLSRFIEEPLRLWEKENQELAEAYKTLHRYGRNMPKYLYDKVRKVMEKYGVWKSRSNWSRDDWNRYWKERALKLNEVDRADFDRLPLLQRELKKVQETYPLRKITPPFSRPRIGYVGPYL